LFAIILFLFTKCASFSLPGDDDSSSLAALRRESDHVIDKWSDLNHARKALSNALWKTPGLPQAVGDYFRKMFGIAVKQHKGDVEGTRAAILAVVPHAFGDHSSCGAWCDHHRDPENYRHKGLPGTFKSKILSCKKKQKKNSFLSDFISR